MKQRQFPLNSVRDVRELAKKNAEDALGAATRERCLAEQRLREALAALAAMAKQLADSHFTAQAQIHGLRALAFQEQACSELKETLVAADRIAGECRQKLVVAYQEHEAILKLQAKWRAGAVREDARISENALDDFVSSRFAMRSFAGNS